MQTDLTNQKINAKVREHSLAHVPVLAVVGRKEAENGTVALRRLGSQAQEVLAAGRRRWRDWRGKRRRRICGFARAAMSLEFLASFQGKMSIVPADASPRTPPERAFATVTGATHSQRTNAAAADSRRAHE